MSMAVLTSVEVCDLTWLGDIPEVRAERRYGTRLVSCFAARPASVPAMLAEAVARNSDGEALIDGERRITWRALDDAASRVAGGLASLGVVPGDRVALLMANCVEFVVAMHAVMRLGAIVVPLNIREERPELTFILGNCGPKVLIYDTGLAAKVPLVTDVASIEHCIVHGRDSGNALRFDTLLSGGVVSPAGISEEDVATILYTSGTTGRPKGAMLTHFSIVHAALIYEACMGLSRNDRSVVTVPMSHVTGLTASIAAMLRVAGALVIAPPFKAETFLALAVRERMTHTVMVPAMYSLCLMSPNMREADLRSWRIGGYGGAPMPEVAIRKLAGDLPGLQLMNAYGSTETSAACGSHNLRTSR